MPIDLIKNKLSRFINLYFLIKQKIIFLFIKFYFIAN